MIQEIIALIIVLAFISRLGWQFWHNQLPKGQFIFWLGFWFIAGILIIFIRSIDSFISQLGFSSTGIQFLFYIAVVVLFYWIFKLRLKMEKMNRHITELTRLAALQTTRKHKNGN